MGLFTNFKKKKPEKERQEAREYLKKFDSERSVLW